MLEQATVSPDQPGTASAPQQTMDGFLADFTRQNPELAWFAQLVAMQRQAAVLASAEPPELEAARAEVVNLAEHLRHSEARADKLQRHARRLAEELDAALDRLSDLAAVLGACGLCWGEDRECRSCRGRGKPGMFAPEPATRSRFFAEAVEPAVKSNAAVTPTDNSERS
jgi:hypothetical protein